MINKDFFLALDLLEKEGKIDKELTLRSLEAAIAAAYKRESGEARPVSVQINEQRNQIRIVAYQEVVETVEDPEKEISLEDAKKIKSSYKVGDRVIEEITPKVFSRIDVQTAKQVFMQRLMDEHKKITLEDMTQKEGEIVTAQIRRIDGDRIYLDISGSQMEGVMMPQDQIKGEIYKQGDVLKVYVKNIRTDFKGGSQVMVSRSHRDFVKRLFEMEVPEIKSGLVKIKKIVREAGYRTKMAVYSDDPSVDAVGSCIGQRGMRINGIVGELNGEKIDVIGWCADPLEYIARALSPAKVIMVQVNDEDKSAKAIVADDKLSLAIGKQGQNVRLAAKLTEWKIDVKPYSSVENIVSAPSNAEDGE